MRRSVVGSNGRRNRMIGTLQTSKRGGRDVPIASRPWLRRLRVEGSGGLPDSIEAVDVGGKHAVAAASAEVQNGGVSGGDTVDVLVDQDLVVAAVKRVVEHRGVQADLHARREQWAVEH